MKIEVNITKAKFFVLLGAILLFGIVGVVYAFGTGNPSNFGHSVSEIDWSQPIQSDVSINGILAVGGQKALAADASSIFVGDMDNGDGLRRLVLRSGDQDRIIVATGGNVGIGVSNPNQQLEVNGNALVSGLIIGNSNKAITYASGNNVACPAGKVPLFRNWNARTCNSGSCGTATPGSSCTTYAGWSGESPECNAICTAATTTFVSCIANSWTEAFCIG